jgi:hypothetical protein
VAQRRFESRPRQDLHEDMGSGEVRLRTNETKDRDMFRAGQKQVEAICSKPSRFEGLSPLLSVLGQGFESSKWACKLAGVA